MVHKKIEFGVSCDKDGCSRFTGYFEEKKEAVDAAIREGWQVGPKGCYCQAHRDSLSGNKKDRVW